MRGPRTSWLGMLMLAGILAPGCNGSDTGPLSATEMPEPPPTGQAGIGIVAGLTVDSAGNTIVPMAADPATPLYYRRTGLPVLSPAGAQLTAGEFTAAQGTADATCLSNGTQLEIALTALIPNATYRVWILTFEAPGFDLTAPNPFEYLVGEGALGPSDRSGNAFQATADGEGTIMGLVPDGAFSEFGSSAPCLLTDVFEWHAVGAFLQPGHAADTDVGPPALFPESAVEQFVFIFKE